MVLAVERRLAHLIAKSTPGTLRRDVTQRSLARMVRITTDVDNERMELAEERRRLNEARDPYRHGALVINSLA